MMPSSLQDYENNPMSAMLRDLYFLIVTLIAVWFVGFFIVMVMGFIEGGAHLASQYAIEYIGFFVVLLMVAE